MTMGLSNLEQQIVEQMERHVAQVEKDTETEINAELLGRVVGRLLAYALKVALGTYIAKKVWHR
jgi:hypothetical protein